MILDLLPWIALAVIVVVAGRRRPWEGTPAAVWWRDQRAHRRPARIWGRLARVLLATVLLLVASVLVTTAVAALALGAGVAALCAIGWYAATRGALKAEPTCSPLEDGRAELLADLDGDEFDRRVVDGDVDLAPDPSVPVRRPEHYRAEIDI